MSKKKNYKPRSGYKLRDTLDQDTLNKLYGLKRRLNRDTIKKSNNKGDQYVRRQKTGERASNSQNQR